MSSLTRHEQMYLNRALVEQALELIARAQVGASDLIDVKEAARLLDINPGTVHDHIRNGNLHWVAKYVLDRREVLDFAATRRRRPRK